jgi:hypothetical protein
MPALTSLTLLSGKWQGSSQLWLAPGEPVRSSETTAEIRASAHEQFTELLYTWAFEGEPQEGRLILGQPAGSTAVNAVWFDTWHMADQFMVCAGSVEEKSVVRVRGSYAAPPGPDWGWEISIEPGGEDAFQLRMYNITPDGQKFLAVLAAYAR